MITFFSPGLRFFHQGQFEGRRKRISPHLIRAPKEALDTAVLEFYTKLLAVINHPLFRNGKWKLLNYVPALEFAWEHGDGTRAHVSVNYAPHYSQCFLQLPFPDLAGKSILLRDLLSTAIYDRDGNELLSKGLYLDLQPWGYHVFELSQHNEARIPSY